MNQKCSFPREKFARYSWVLVVTELVVSGTQCNIFTGVCHSIHGGGGGVGYGAIPPRSPDPPPTTKAGGTHPTGMLSCLCESFKNRLNHTFK